MRVTARNTYTCFKGLFSGQKTGQKTLNKNSSDEVLFGVTQRSEMNNLFIEGQDRFGFASERN